jgi:opacity protein-like surface antigen
MKTKIKFSVIAAAALVTIVAPLAHAETIAVGRSGVISGNGIKDYRQTVPVPMPNPANEPSRDWYVRGDIGWNFYAHGDTEARGGLRVFDQDETAAGVFGGIGFGRYMTPSWRFDITFDAKAKQRAAPGSQTYAVRNAALGLPATYDIAHQEDAYTTNYTGLVNIYYDLQRRGSFQPYLGAGLGAGFQRYQRNFTNTATCRTFDDDNDPLTPDVACNATVGPVAGKGSQTTIGLALALMAGFTVDLAPGIKLDNNYRFLWQNTGTTAGGADVFGSAITIGNADRYDHELRTGIRIDLTP